MTLISHAHPVRILVYKEVQQFKEINKDLYSCVVLHLFIILFKHMVTYQVIMARDVTPSLDQCVPPGNKVDEIFCSFCYRCVKKWCPPFPRDINKVKYTIVLRSIKQSDLINTHTGKNLLIIIYLSMFNSAHAFISAFLIISCTIQVP